MAAFDNPTHLLSMLSVGEMFAGRYEIVAKLGAGGMSSVYQARDRLAGDVVALKVLEPHLARDSRMIEQFKKELLGTRRLSHRNVIRIHDIGEHSGALFIRSNWEDDAVWFGLYEGEAQLFQEGKITVLKQTGPLASQPKPIAVGDASVLLGRSPMRFPMDGGPVLVLGLKPSHKYLIEADDEELREAETDSVGTLVLEYPADRSAGVRIMEVNSASGGT